MSLNNNPNLKAVWSFSWWTVTCAFLIVIIITGSAIIWSKHDRGRGIEISLQPEKEPISQVNVGGEVNNPGLYPLQAGDKIDDILKAAGGLNAIADPGQLKLYVAGKGEADVSQQVDINSAGAWLLAALPGIGETRALSIISYREKNGLFRDIKELLKVPGIGSTTFEGIKNLITVN